MKQSSLMKIISLNICILSLFLVSTIVPAYSNGELVVAGIHRISHPAYTTDNYWYTTFPQWNVDKSRILIYEIGIATSNGKYYHPNFPSSYPNARDYGRGLIWGCLKTSCVSASRVYRPSITSTLQALDLDNASGNQSLIDWDNNTVQISATAKYQPVPAWSPYPGETNILYAINRNTQMLVTYNVDTGVETPITSYYHSSGVTNAQILGFTKDAVTGSLGHKDQIIIQLDYSKRPGGYIYRVFTDRDNNFSSPTKQYEAAPGSCSSAMTWYPDPPQVHSAVSPDGLYTAGEDAMFKNDFSGSTCSGSVNGGTGNPYSGKYWWWNNISHDNKYGITHINWGASNDWYIAANNTNYPYNYQTETAPHIGVNEQKIWQVYFDRTLGDTRLKANCNNGYARDECYCPECFTHNELVSRSSAGNWFTPTGTVVNYPALALPTISSDGTLLRFQGTNGKYTREDKSWCDKITPNVCNTIGNNWEGIGTYIAELAPVSGAQTCTTFAYSTWSECQPNKTQTRTVISSSPSGCSGGNPELVRSCTFSPDALYNILKTASTPAIDGNLGEYALANPLSFSPSSGGNTVTVRTLWDSEAIYLGINVTDTQLNASVTTRDGGVWSEDSLEWFIDTYYDGGGSSNPSSAYMRPDDYHGILSILNTKYDSQGTTSGTPSSSWNGTWQSAVKLNGTVNNNADADIGYSIEIKIPWTSIGYSSAPSQDTSIGMSFALNDKDAATVTSIMMPDITSGFENASNWRSVLLSGTAAFVDATPPAPPMALMIQ